MATLSVIIITRNEEKNLVRALESVKFADQIVICDSHSTDRTIEIAESFNCEIITRDFTGYGAAKQAALEQASGDWVLSIDADEEVDDKLRAEIKRIVTEGTLSGYFVNRKSRFLGRWMNHSGWYPDWILRLFRRGQGSFSEDRVHESIRVDGSTGQINGHLLHYTDPDISHYLSKLDRYTTLSAESLAGAERRFKKSDLLLKPFAVFVKIYIMKRGFRDGIQGLLLASFSSFHVLCKYAKLWELERK